MIKCECEGERSESAGETKGLLSGNLPAKYWQNTTFYYHFNNAGIMIQIAGNLPPF